MEQHMKPTEFNQEIFFDVMRKAYEKGLNEKEMTVERIVEDLKNDLKNTLLK